MIKQERIEALERRKATQAIETQLAVTRDLERWERPFRTPIIPLGKPGEWDGGMILTASQAIDVGDEVWMYYGGTNYTHGAPILYGEKGDERGTKFSGAIGLATWPRARAARGLPTRRMVQDAVIRRPEFAAGLSP